MQTPENPVFHISDEGRFRLLSVIERTGTIVRDEEEKRAHGRIGAWTFDTRKQNVDAILDDAKVNARWILQHPGQNGSCDVLRDSDERLPLFLIAGLTQNLQQYGIPREAADAFLAYAQTHENRLIREEAVVMLEMNGSFPLTDTVRRAYEGKRNRTYGDGISMEQHRVVDPLKYVANRDGAWETQSSWEFPDKNNYWKMWHGYPLMSLVWYGGTSTMKDFLCVDPNFQVLTQDLQYLVDKQILTRWEEGGFLSPKRTFFRITNQSDWTGPLW